MICVTSLAWVPYYADWVSYNQMLWKVILSVAAKTLSNIPAFRRLTPATLECVAQAAVIVSQQKREIFYQQGAPPTGLFALQSGCVKLYRQSEDRMQILALIMPGECFGAESLPDNTPSPCSATTLIPSTAIYIPPDSLFTILLNCPDLQGLLLDLISARLKQFVSLVHNLAFRDVTARLATVLLSRAEVEGEPTAEGIRISRILTQTELASMVGTAREVVYRTFKKFERDGVARLTRTHILIIDIDKLTDIAGREIR